MRASFVATAAILVALAAQPLRAQLPLCPQPGSNPIEIRSADDLAAALNCIFTGLQDVGPEEVVLDIFGQILQTVLGATSIGELPDCETNLTTQPVPGTAADIPSLLKCASEFELGSDIAEGVAAAAVIAAVGDPSQADGPRMDVPPCSDKSVRAAAVRSRSDVVAFVNCALEYLALHGTAEAARAFREDARWKSGPTYVFVDELLPGTTQFNSIVFPPDPSLEEGLGGPSVDSFGTDIQNEIYRVVDATGAGWAYYSFRNPDTGLAEPKATFAAEVDWDGKRAVLGAGVYEANLPGTCHADHVSASRLEADLTDRNLEAFVRCAANLVERKGFFATLALARDPRWRSGSIYVFGVDPRTGAQLFTGNLVRVDGRELLEFKGLLAPDGPLGGRDMLGVARTFGDVYFTYEMFNPTTGRAETKVSYLETVSAQGVPVLVGAGLYLGPPER